MKKLILVSILVGLIAVPALGNATLDGVSPHLGWWDPDHPRATHQYWDFTVNVVEDGALWDWEANPPTEIDNSFAIAFIAADIYDQDHIEDPVEIGVLLQIENFPDPLAFKELWVDIGFTGTLIGVGATSGGGEEVVYLPGPGPSGVAEFGFLIIPNPAKEDIWFTIVGPDPRLDYIHMDTICIPAPGAILLGGIGVALVGWLRRRRSL